MKLYILVTFNLIANGINGQLPVSPFGDHTKICQVKNGISYNVDGYPGTPYLIKPFTNKFVNPIDAIPLHKVCRNDTHCMISYNMDIVDKQIRMFDGIIPSCKKFPATWFLTYGGKIPGPTITVPSGHETFVRFNNKISTRYFKQSRSPCINGRKGHPVSIHLHGSASLPPYDGWAEDETCAGETKDYIYPNNRPITGWYHDHALHVTADNAYHGLVGGYIVSSKKKHGGCGEHWNMENIEEKLMILEDKVLDSKCQLYVDIFGPHKNNLYGDINTVSGIPFPVMELQPKWYRFRIINAAASRPYLIKIVDEMQKEVSSNICKIVAADGGNSATPVNFPTRGLLIGVAERYEIVCDFTNLGNKKLYFWNDKDEAMMKAVPYYCYSHLVAKIVVGVNKQQSIVSLDTTAGQPRAEHLLERVFSADDFNTAKAMINNGQYHRKMSFGRSNGHWTINGESWVSFKIAADNVGQNTWELWLFETGGGWFHPIHMHLVDFFLLKREGGHGIEEYERMVPKDVFYLGPSNKVWVIARFGAHKGDYMFHCHNLIHEDNDMLRAYHITDGMSGMNKNTSSQYVVNPLVDVIYNNWAYADPMYGNTAAKPTNNVQPMSAALTTDYLNKNLHRIFYPTSNDLIIQGNHTNPWVSSYCAF